jgi:hypothetical protein
MTDMALEPVIFLFGCLCLALVLWDVFQTIVVPRPTPGRFRITRYLIAPTWRAWLALGARVRGDVARDQFYGLYAPAAVVVLLATWLLLLTVGYGLVLYAVRADLDPPPNDILSSIYLGGNSILTLGSAGVVAVGPLGRLFTLLSAATGLGVVALAVTFLFSLYGSYQRREALVVMLLARAKAPPSAVTLLETYGRLGLAGELPALFSEWERWSAEVLDSHVAYPILCYFRSSHDNASWISALGAVLDAAGLVLTTIRGVPRGPAKLMTRVGSHLVEDVSNYFRLQGDGAIVDRTAFDHAHNRLAAAGYEVEDVDIAWRAFERVRGTYAGRLEALARFWATPAPIWLGERSTFVSFLSPVHRAASPAPSGTAGETVSDRTPERAVD